MQRAVALEYLFKALEKKHIKYCVLHSYEGLPKTFDSDIDITIEENRINDIEKILMEMERDIEWKVCQKIQHEYCCYYYVLYKKIDNELYYLQLDFNTDYVRDNRFCLSNKFILENRIKFNGFYIPNEIVEFTYLTIKKIMKKKMKEEQKNKLVDIYEKNKENCSNEIKKFFSKKEAQIYLRHLENRLENIDYDIGLLRQDLIDNLGKKYKNENIKYKVLNCKRIIKRICKPTGVHICLQGPDGVGKTTIAYEMVEELKECFRRTSYYHLKPTLNSDGKSRRGSSEIAYEFDFDYKPTIKEKILSPIRIVYNYFNSYIKNYFLSVYNQKIKSTLIVFDRYFIDFAIFPEAKKYYGNVKFPAIMSRLAPRPDITFYLDCPAEKIIERKKELPVCIIKEQQQRIVDFKKYIKNLNTINTDKDIREIRIDISYKVLEFMNYKYKKKFLESKNRRTL